MGKIQLSALVRKPGVLLGLILAAFLCREAFLVALYPMFTGQDEARHYNTVQWLSEERDQTCLRTTNDQTQDKGDLGTYRFSEEIRQTSDAAGLSVWRDENYRKPPYAPGNTGYNERLIADHPWTREMTVCPPDIATNARSFSLFHWAGSLLERGLGESDVMTRFYLIRLLSVLFGAATVLLTYLIAVEAGFSRRLGLLLAFILSLQPKLSVYTTNINYDALLIPLFALFLYAGVRCLKRGVTLGNAALLVTAALAAALTKGTGLVLILGILFLCGLRAYEHRGFWKQLPLLYWLTGLVLTLFFILAVVATYPVFDLLPRLTPASLVTYLEKSLPKIPSSSENFWGVVDWTAADLGSWFVWIIWTVEAVALYGLIRYFRASETPTFLPGKRVTLFLIVLWIALQLGVRLHDWHVFQETGELLLGTPGRYFLPTLVAQLILLSVGLGALLRREVRLERALIALALLLLAFHLYDTWLVILPRFYL